MARQWRESSPVGKGRIPGESGATPRAGQPNVCGILRAVAAALHVHDLSPPDPRDEVAAALRAGCATWAPGRERVLLIASHGERAGLAPAPWTVDAAVAAASPAGYAELGPHEGRRLQRCLHASGMRDLGTPDAPHLAVRLPGAHARALVPRAWIGRAAVLVTPLVHVATRAGTPTQGDARFQGPVASSLCALARHCGVEAAGPGLAHLGARLLDEIFAHVTVVVDAAWWAARIDDQAEAAALTPVGRLVVLADPPARDTLFDLDTWLLQRLGLRAGTRGVGVPIRGPAAEASWPRVTLPVVLPPRRPGLRTIRALWRPDDGSGHGLRGPRPALPRPIPGPLRDAWDRYGSV